MSLWIVVESFLELFLAACHLEQQGRDLPHQSFRLSRTLSFPIELEPLLIVGSLEEFVCLKDSKDFFIFLFLVFEFLTQYPNTQTIQIALFFINFLAHCVFLCSSSKESSCLQCILLRDIYTHDNFFLFLATLG